MIAPITVLFDRIEEEEDVGLCAYASMGVAFKTTMVNSSPAIATLINRVLKKKFENDSLCIYMTPSQSINHI